jgi:hypothetical protein
VVEKGRGNYWKLVFSTVFKRPRSLPVAMKLAIYGYHFRKVAEKYVGKAFGFKEAEQFIG